MSTMKQKRLPISALEETAGVATQIALSFYPHLPDNFGTVVGPEARAHKPASMNN